MSKKEKVDQGSHTDGKNKAKPVESEVTKELKKGDEVTKALQQQAERELALKAEKAAEENANRVVDATEVKSHTRESYKALIERYKKENPIKYKLKEGALEAKLKTL